MVLLLGEGLVKQTLPKLTEASTNQLERWFLKTEENPQNHFTNISIYFPLNIKLLCGKFIQKLLSKQQPEIIEGKFQLAIFL